jgi:DNA (cytosine-5)-methyltransferase 1
MSARIIRAVDLYCGAGGSSRGLKLACDTAGAKLRLIAINHWNVAIATHELNLPDAEHLCTSVDSVDPRSVVPSGHLDLLWASPECIHFSVARGGRPVNDQSRASAWHVLRWAEALKIDNIVIENVKEFRTWGPIGANGKPLRSKRGETYFAFLNALRSLNYRVEDRILNAADYGDPTTRERLFIIARRGRKTITWPEPTHAPSDNPRLFGKRSKWKAARAIIDWSIAGQSIFTRKKPLAKATLQRILAGLEKFGGKELQPFLVVMRNHADARSVEDPLPALTASGQHFGVCEPFILAPPRISRKGHMSTRSTCPFGRLPPSEDRQTGPGAAVHRPVLWRTWSRTGAGEPRSGDAPMPAVTSHGAGAKYVQPWQSSVLVGSHAGERDGAATAHTLRR